MVRNIYARILTCCFYATRCRDTVPMKIVAFIVFLSVWTTPLLAMPGGEDVENGSPKWPPPHQIRKELRKDVKPTPNANGPMRRIEPTPVQPQPNDEGPSPG